MDITEAQLKALANPISALPTGKAAEHMVCAHLIMMGYQAYLSDQGLPYDIVVDIDGRLIRVQVKSTVFAKNINTRGKTERIGYSFHVRRRGKSGGKRLTKQQCDIVAMLAFDIMKIAYLPIEEVAQTCQFMPPGYSFKGQHKRTRGTTIDNYPFDKALSRSLS